MTGHIISHLVRRGVEHVTSAQQAYIEHLQHDAELYENAGPTMEVKPRELLPVFITAAIGLFIIWSISYTVGNVISSLAMIESPSSTAIVEPKQAPPPPYNDEPDAPLEKEPLMVVEDRDVEVTVMQHSPISSHIPKAIGHLHRVGGFRARWRGLGLSVLYHFLHAAMANSLTHFLGFGIVGEAFMYIFASMALMRVHMAWTHAMIAYPSSKAWFRRVPSRRECKALLLPAFVYAVAQQASMILPIGVGFALGIVGPQAEHMRAVAQHEHCAGKIILMGLRFAAVPLTYIFVGLAVLLPASVTLTRIEASLLPEGEETIVPFDKDMVVGEIDVNVRGGCKAVFVQAWRSFDRASRWRLIKLYAKMVFAQVAVAFIAVHLIVAELYVIGGERLGVFFKSAFAQLKLMAIEAHQARVEGN